jgi:hypothetical protein
MEEMDGLVCEWEKSTVKIERNAAPFRFQIHFSVVGFNIHHPPFQKHLSFPLVDQTLSSAESLYAVMWTADW